MDNPSGPDRVDNAKPKPDRMHGDASEADSWLEAMEDVSESDSDLDDDMDDSETK